MIRLGTLADLPAAAGVYRRASLSNAGDRDHLLAHPEVTANAHAEGFYSAAGFVDCGVAETAFGSASRKRLAIR